jgi:transitional endoplasmic reticulum ATPase
MSLDSGRSPTPALEPTTIPPSIWDALTDSEGRKRLVERKILLPLLRKHLARKHGLAPARAVLLFGPPGTGKTHFARAIAARLEWALIEADLSAVALHPVRLANLLRQLFGLREVVVLFDEFEHLAMRRAPDRTEGRSITNEFLKWFDTLVTDGRLLLVCATNHVDLLDPALLRPGRFDFVVPVEPPDAMARRQLFEECLTRAEAAQVDLDRIVSAAEGLTAADIAEVWNRAAQRSFERELTTGRSSPVTTEDLVGAIATHRPSLSREDLEAFEHQMRAFARL